jgi:N-acetylmuramoyl-L-alanine amidase
MTLRERLSPNHGPRPAGKRVDMLLLHYTGMPSVAASLDRLCDPEAQVSAHYLVEEDGAVWRLVEEGRRAWHAGQGFWAGETDINGVSIGIELANPGHEWGYLPFPEAQVAALETLAHDILARHAIPSHRVLGHSDVAPQRKQDPGELFPWERLARGGIGLWPRFRDLQIELGEPRVLLARIGYDTAGELGSAVTAFQRHWRPDRCDGELDGETMQRIAAVARAMP